MSRYIDADALHDALKAKQKWVVRYGIMVHVKGTSYENDYWFTDNKYFRVREFSHEAAEAALRILQRTWGDGYSFRIRRLD